jgi:hypothetical protein
MATVVRKASSTNTRKKTSKKKAVTLPVVDFKAALAQARSTSSIIWCMCEVDPALAGVILSSNVKNRSIVQSRVNKYAGAMQRKKWRSEKNGDPIRINVNGNLCDGQHRIKAVIESGTTQTFVFCFNLSIDSFKTFDCGKIRTLADCLSITGHKNSTSIAASLNLIQRWEMGDMHGSYSLTNEEGVTLISKRPDIVESVEFALRVRNSNLMPRSGVAFLHYVFSKRNKKMASEFISKMESGESLPKDHPIYVLRDRLIRAKGKSKSHKMSRLKQLALAVKAWNHLRNNKDSITRLIWKEGIEEFPVVL